MVTSSYPFPCPCLCPYLSLDGLNLEGRNRDIIKAKEIIWIMNVNRQGKRKKDVKAGDESIR